MELKINWEHKRAKHAIERMWLRGISHEEIKTAIKKGQKKMQKKTGLMESFHSYYSVVYAEYFFNNKKLRKVYPVTVKIW